MSERRWTIVVCQHGFRVECFRGQYRHMSTPAQTVCLADPAKYERVEVVPARPVPASREEQVEKGARAAQRAYKNEGSFVDIARAVLDAALGGMEPREEGPETAPIECPTCGAPPGKPCNAATEGKAQRFIHDARAARAAVSGGQRNKEGEE